MTPFQKKMRSLGPAKYLPIRINNLPAQIPEEELAKLVQQLKENRSLLSVKNKIIEGHLRLGISIAARFASKSKFRVDDLVGEMLLCIVESVPRFCGGRGYDNNITPYLVSCIHSRLSTFIEEDRTIHMPGRTVRHYTATGSNKLDKMPLQIYLAQGGTISTSMDEYEGPENFKSPYILPETIDDHSGMEVLEILDKVTNNFIEKRVIKLRAEGLSYKEISPLVGYSQASISIMVQSIEERFNKMYKTSS